MRRKNIFKKREGITEVDTSTSFLKGYDIIYTRVALLIGQINTKTNQKYIIQSNIHFKTSLLALDKTLKWLTKTIACCNIP